MMKRSKRQKPKKPAMTSIKKGDENDERVLVDSNGQIKLKVTVVRVVSPSQFFVTLDYTGDSYKTMQVKMNEFYKKKDFSNEELMNWQLGDVCAIKRLDGAWKRAVVVCEQKLGRRVQVRLVDDAEEILVSNATPGNLTELDNQFRHFIDKTLECTLGGIVPAESSSWTHDSISKMNEFITTHQDNLYISKMNPVPSDENKPVLHVLLQVKPSSIEPDGECWLSLNHLLVWKGLATVDQYTKWDDMGNVIDVKNNLMEEEAEILASLLRSAFGVTAEGAIDLSSPVSNCLGQMKIKWPPSDPPPQMKFTANVTFVGPNCEIWVQDHRNAAKLDAINAEAVELCESTDPPDHRTWENGDICLGRYYLDNKWYRAEIIKANATHNRHLVRFVDYGNEEYLETHELRHASGMTIRPIQAHICYFDNLASIGNSWQASHIQGIHLLLVDKQVSIELRVLSSNLLGIRNMVLPDGSNAITKIVTKNLGMFHILSCEITKKVNSKPKSSNTAVLLPKDVICEERIESQEEGAVPYATQINYWLNMYETADEYLLPIGGFKLLNIPLEVDEVMVDITAIVSPELCMMQVINSNDEELKRISESYNELLMTMQLEAESQPGLEPPYLYKECCCKFEDDQKWYRAVVLLDSSDEDGTVVVQFVDYGNVQQSPVDRVKQIKDSWFSVPVQSIPCCISGYTFRHDLPEVEAMVYLRCVLIDQPFVKATIMKRKKNLLVEFYNKDGKLLYQPLIEHQMLLPTTSGC